MLMSYYSVLNFIFFHYRIGLDGRNFEFGALGALGIDVGAVSGGWGGASRNPDSNPAKEKTGIFY
jgi:hypothetical protein